MTDGRTGEQKAADKNLTAAIERVMRANSPEVARELLLVEYVVLAASTGFDAVDGDPRTAVWIHPRDSNQVAPHRLLGLMEYGCQRLKSGIGVEEPWS